MAFRGTYEHTLDDRGRVAIPARYRHLFGEGVICLLYTSPSPRDRTRSRMPSSA